MRFDSSADLLRDGRRIALGRAVRTPAVAVEFVVFITSIIPCRGSPECPRVGARGEPAHGYLVENCTFACIAHGKVRKACLSAPQFITFACIAHGKVKKCHSTWSGRPSIKSAAITTLG